MTATDTQQALPGVPTPATQKTRTRYERKYPEGERGYNPGEWPTRGPYVVQRRSQPDRMADGRVPKTKYAHVARLTEAPPADDWLRFLARNYGPGHYTVEGRNNVKRPARFEVTALQARTFGFGEPPDDDEPDENDEADNEPASNPPPETPLEAFRRNLTEIEAVKKALGISQEAAAPGGIFEKMALQVLSNPAALNALVRAFQAPPAPPAPPAPQPAPPDPWRDVIADLQARGLDPAEVRQAFEPPQPFAAAMKESAAAESEMTPETWQDRWENEP